MNNSFFLLFVNLIDESLKKDSLTVLLEIKGKTLRERILNFSESYVVYCEPEYSIKAEDGSHQIPDILLRIQKKIGEKEIAYLIIENKIKKSAIQKGQLEKQFDYFTQSEEYEEGKPVYSILITPDESVFESTYKDGKNNNPNTIWLKWVNHSTPEKSIESTLRQLIISDQKAEIEPIDPNTKFILKSFIDYIANEFMKRTKGKKNHSYKGFEEVDAAFYCLKEKNYYIKRYSNKMIRLFDKDGDLLEMDVKPILREIIKEYSLNIELKLTTGRNKNTRSLGREIINELKKKNEG